MQDPNRIKELLERLEALERKHSLFNAEIRGLRKEIEFLQTGKVGETLTEAPVDPKVPSVDFLDTSAKQPPKTAAKQTEKDPRKSSGIGRKKPFVKKSMFSSFTSGGSKDGEKGPKRKSGLEEFIGKNLIAVIGIAVLVLGIGFGVKYSIDNNLISPVTRIILGYLAGLGILGAGIALKKKYEGFSAILVSGAMASFYFITFAAFSFYNLMPQLAAFAMMVVFTLFTVAAAIKYDRQIIAHVGLVGAYLVPVLLSDGSGQVAILFTYMAIINAGILVLALQKYWKPLYYTAFVATWAIYSAWHVDNYDSGMNLGLALFFASLFFLIFYATALAYKVMKKEKFNVSDVILILSNSFLYFGFGYSLMIEDYEAYLGLFAVANAVVHFAVAMPLNMNKLIDRSLVHFLAGLVLVFLTIAVPVQLDGNWVTLLWIAEAVLVFYLGRVRNIKFYEMLTFPLVLLAVGSLIHDWGEFYGHYYMFEEEVSGKVTSIFNIQFLSTVLLAVGLGVMAWWNNQPKYLPEGDPRHSYKSLLDFMFLFLPLVILFIGVELEIYQYWDQLEEVWRNKSNNDMSMEVDFSFRDFSKFGALWGIWFMMGYFTLLSVISLKVFKKEGFSFAMLIINSIGVLIFLAAGLTTLATLRDHYLAGNILPIYTDGGMYFAIRYIGIGLAAGLLTVSWFLGKKAEQTSPFFANAFEFVFHFSILTILSAELIQLMSVGGDSGKAYRIALSVLWGAYSLLLIVLGIWKKRQILRLGGMGLFAVTLFKLFLYDLAKASTPSRIISFVAIGIILLIISFLYNKYKDVIIGGDAKPSPTPLKPVTETKNEAETTNTDAAATAGIDSTSAEEE